MTRYQRSSGNGRKLLYHGKGLNQKETLNIECHTVWKSWTVQRFETKEKTWMEGRCDEDFDRGEVLYRSSTVRQSTRVASRMILTVSSATEKSQKNWPRLTLSLGEKIQLYGFQIRINCNIEIPRGTASLPSLVISLTSPLGKFLMLRLQPPTLPDDIVCLGEATSGNDIPTSLVTVTCLIRLGVSRFTLVSPVSPVRSTSK